LAVTLRLRHDNYDCRQTRWSSSTVGNVMKTWIIINTLQFLDQSLGSIFDHTGFKTRFDQYLLAFATTMVLNCLLHQEKTTNAVWLSNKRSSPGACAILAYPSKDSASQEVLRQSHKQ